MIKLKACPFCGHKATLIEDEIEGDHVECSWCYAKSTSCARAEDTIENWNRRANEN